MKLVISVYVDNLFMASNSETSNNTKTKIKEKFNIAESGKLKKFLIVYYEWGLDAKNVYTKMIINKDVKKLVED